jgi:pantetheine-phosphate adenylyltransferase
MPGSFDPFTLGHWDIVTRAARLFSEVIIAVGANDAKQCHFPIQTRLAMAQACAQSLDNVQVAIMSGLLVDFCRDHDAMVAVRGARSGSDFEAESAMALMNADLGAIETVILPASSAVGFISSTLVRSILRAGGDAYGYVPEPVAQMMQKEL